MKSASPRPADSSELFVEVNVGSDVTTDRINPVKSKCFPAGESRKAAQHAFARDRRRSMKRLGLTIKPAANISPMEERVAPETVLMQHLTHSIESKIIVADAAPNAIESREENCTGSLVATDADATASTVVVAAEATINSEVVASENNAGFTVK
jgi:hypothetical protein